MTEFWHFSYPFNVRNYPSEFENKRTNTSSVILCQLCSLPFFGESVRGRAAECLSFYKVLVLKKKKIWLLTEVWVFFNVWVTVRSTVQNSLSASLSAGNCQWQKQNYEYFFFFFCMDFKTSQLTNSTSFLYKAVDSALSAFFKRMKVSRSVGSSVSWALCSPTLGSTSSPQCTLMW